MDDGAEEKIRVWRRIKPVKPRWTRVEPTEPREWKRVEVTPREWERIKPGAVKTEDE